MEIRVEGAKELRRNLRSVNRELPKMMTAIHNDVAGPVALLAKQKARKRSGRMRGAIKAKSTTTMARVQVGPLIYAPVQHFGWPGHNISPNPFLFEAISERADESVRLYDRLLGEAVERMWT